MLFLSDLHFILIFFNKFFISKILLDSLFARSFIPLNFDVPLFKAAIINKIGNSSTVLE